LLAILRNSSIQEVINWSPEPYILTIGSVDLVAEDCEATMKCPKCGLDPWNKPRRDKCENCGVKLEECEVCHGYGDVPGNMQFEKCHKCNGTGAKIKK
jgi:hypothetical protein